MIIELSMSFVCRDFYFYNQNKMEVKKMSDYKVNEATIAKKAELVDVYAQKND